MIIFILIISILLILLVVQHLHCRQLKQKIALLEAASHTPSVEQAPILSPIPEESTKELPIEKEKETNKYKLLVIEDHKDIQLYLKVLFGKEYEFHLAENGEEGLKKAQDIMPDLIITDIMMPGMDGFELCQKIRSSELLSHIPVIIVTARTSKEDRIKGLQAGADSYIEKPFDGDILQTRVKMLLEQRDKLKQFFSELSSNAILGTNPNSEINPYKPNCDENNGTADNKLSENKGINFCKDKAFIDKLNELIQSQMENGCIDYVELGCKFSITRIQLNRKIKAITGMTTTEYILQLRISLAKKLLSTTDLPIGEIAFKCGVDDVSYFSALFKKHTGTSPTLYRNNQ